MEDLTAILTSHVPSLGHRSETQPLVTVRIALSSVWMRAYSVDKMWSKTSSHHVWTRPIEEQFNTGVSYIRNNLETTKIICMGVFKIVRKIRTN